VRSLCVCVCVYVGGTAIYLFIYACKSCESDVVDDGGVQEVTSFTHSV
jgi:hypothetical protein